MVLYQGIGKATVVPIHKGGHRSVGKNYRPVSLTSVICKQTEHVIAGYIRQVWEIWIGYARDNMASDRDTRARVKYVGGSNENLTVCQDISKSLHEAARLDAIIIDFFESFSSSPS